MAQRQKPEIREAILQAAAAAFADGGFEGAALGDIAERAGTSIGSLATYCANKDERFADVTPRGFTTELTNRIRTQVEALRAEPDAFGLDASHPYRRASEDVLACTVAHRERVVFRLLRAQGT